MSSYPGMESSVNRLWFRLNPRRMSGIVSSRDTSSKERFASWQASTASKSCNCSAARFADSSSRGREFRQPRATWTVSSSSGKCFSSTACHAAFSSVGNTFAGSSPPPSTSMNKVAAGGGQRPPAAPPTHPRLPRCIHQRRKSVCWKLSATLDFDEQGCGGRRAARTRRPEQAGTAVSDCEQGLCMGQVVRMLLFRELLGRFSQKPDHLHVLFEVELIGTLEQYQCALALAGTFGHE